MTSKFLAAIPEGPEWDGTFTTPKRHGQPMPGYIDVIIKVEQPGYEGITALEELCYQVHETRGLLTPRRWLTEIEVLRLLAVERFDRTREGVPIPYESLFNLFAGGSQRITGTADVELTEIPPKLTKLARLVSMDKRQVLAGLFERFVLALVTGNGDLHLDNLGLLGGPREVKLAPVFDPAPMRAWPRHNQRLATPIDFVADVPVYRQIANAGRSFGLDEKASVRLLHEVFQGLNDYLQRIEGRDGVPTERKSFLLAVLQAEAKLVEALAPK